jgi:hypothetical protein
VIGNLGSYIGAHGEALFDRGLDELIFRSAVWATGTQLVRFSTGANQMIRGDLGKETADRLDAESVLIPNPSFDPEKHATPESEVKPFEVVTSASVVLIAEGRRRTTLSVMGFSTGKYLVLNILIPLIHSLQRIPNIGSLILILRVIV